MESPDFTQELSVPIAGPPAQKTVCITKKRPGPKCFRFTKENETRFLQIHELLALHNHNLTINRIIETYADYLKYKPKIEGMKVAMRD
jgi:hypothetical protein